MSRRRDVPIGADMCIMIKPSAAMGGAEKMLASGHRFGICDLDLRFDLGRVLSAGVRIPVTRCFCRTGHPPRIPFRCGHPRKTNKAVAVHVLVSIFRKLRSVSHRPGTCKLRAARTSVSGVYPCPAHQGASSGMAGASLLHTRYISVAQAGVRARRRALSNTMPVAWRCWPLAVLAFGGAGPKSGPYLRLPHRIVLLPRETNGDPIHSHPA